MPDAPKIVGGTDYLQAAGLFARAFSSFVLEPQDVTGAINDLVKAISLLSVKVAAEELVVARSADVVKVMR